MFVHLSVCLFVYLSVVGAYLFNILGEDALNVSSVQVL